MSVQVSAVASQPLATRAWATATSYVVIYGVTYAFFAPPAAGIAAKAVAADQVPTISFALFLFAALTVTFGAAMFAYSIGWRVEARARRHSMSDARATGEFALWGSLMSLFTAAVFVAVVGASEPLSSSLIWAAVLALVVPGVTAAFFTRAVVDHVAAAKRELLATSVAALTVVVLTNYLIVGNLPPLADVPRLLGL